ncbi:response regulator [Pseudoalteromonas tunicata]|jgi:DNA-binding winged helix-turn-helix (wHTH) protein/CheY-like chemotaxis protein|nr:response regulator [Pseudoalteromonas tunicata]
MIRKSMRYSFDSFVLNTRARTLHHHNEILLCDERIVLLLGLLIEAYPDHCQQADLLKQIWPNTVVSNWSIARLISDSRKFFLFAGLHPPLIETLRGRGYRLSHEIGASLVKLEDENLDSVNLVDRDSSAIKENWIEPSSTVLVLPEAEPSTSTKNSRHYKKTTVTRILLSLFGAVLTIFSLVFALDLRWPNEPSKLVINEPHDVKARILWVDDHPENNEIERKELLAKKFGVYLTKTTQDAMTLLSLYRYDAIITDMGREDDPLAGLKFIKMVRQQSLSTPIFLYTIMPSQALQTTVLNEGGHGVATTSESLYQLLDNLAY